jgi:hypothetical protein
MFDPNTLYASVLWGALGAGLVAFGKKQGNAPTLIGGLTMIGVTFFIYSPPLLAVAGCVIILGIYAAHRLGF